MRKSVAVRVGNIIIGNTHPIVIQSMTNTVTSDIESTFVQIKALYKSGSELVRISVNDELAAQAVPIIKKKIAARRM